MRKEFATDPTDVVIRIPEIVMGDEGPVSGQYRPARRGQNVRPLRQK